LDSRTQDLMLYKVLNTIANLERHQREIQDQINELRDVAELLQNNTEKMRTCQKMTIYGSRPW
jgi:hypothetical protein